MSAWPLEAELLLDLEETFRSNRLRVENQAGPPTMRALGTAGVGKFNGQIILDGLQVRVLEMWGESSEGLAGWCLPFFWTHPRTGKVVRMQFRTVPSARRFSVGTDGDDQYTVPMDLEVLP